MLKRIFALAGAIALIVLALPALSAEQANKPAAAIQAPALSPAHALKLQRLQRLAAPDPKFALLPGVRFVMKPTSVKKEISCGVWLYPPNPNPAATSPRIFWINTTGQTLPPGVRIEWQVEGYPPACCNGVNGPTNFPWYPNPPSIQYVYSTNPVLAPPQPWTRECKAWVIIP